MVAAVEAGEFTAPRPIAGYRVVVTCFLLAVYAWTLGFYGLSVYVQYLGGEAGRSPTLLSTATTWYFLLGAAAMSGAGRVADRLGWRTVASAGVLLMAGSASALAWLPGNAATFVAYAGLAVGWAACSGTAITQIVGQWFQLRRGLALSLALTGASFGGIVGVPLLVGMIGMAGIRWGVTLAALGMAAVMLPLIGANLVAPGTGTAQGAPSTDMRAHGSSAIVPTERGRLIRVGAMFAAGWFAQVAFIAMQIPILVPRLGASGAALAVSMTTAAAVAGRFALGAVVDRLDHRRLTAASFLIQAAGMGILLTSEAPVAAFVGCVLFGLSVGNVITLPAVFAQHEFDRQAYGTVVTRIWTAGQLVFAFGPAAAGWLMQASGDAWPVLAGCATFQVLAALACARRFAGDGARLRGSSP